MPHDVFISYSSLDKTAADATCAALEAAGIRCWIAPRDIIPGKEWGDAIIEAINASRVLVLIFSANANASPQIRREVERAVHKGIPIIPLRIEDILPTHALEYFIGTVHWLDALTPPLENHLRRLAESVRTLLQIDPTPPRILAGNHAAALVTAPARKYGTIVAAVLVASIAAVGGTWWFIGGKKSMPVSPPAPKPAIVLPVPKQSPAETAKPAMDPLVVGTFFHAGVVDGYSANFVYSLTADGAYRLTTNLDERGTFLGGNGAYRTISNTGYVRTGTYRAVGTDAMELVDSDGASAVFRPAESLPPLDLANPAMLGLWRANVVKDGLSWTWSVQNNSDGTFATQGQSQDSGTCRFGDAQWSCTSAITGRSGAGTYRVLDQRMIEIKDADRSSVWQRQQ